MTDLILNDKAYLVDYYKPTKGREKFQLFYKVPEAHREHAPARVTMNGKIWEKKLFDIYSGLLEDDDIVIDVGGYIGSHALPFAKCCPKGLVYCFEPNKELYRTICDNTELNVLDNIRLYDVGVSSKSGYNTLYERQDGTSRISKRLVKGNPAQIEVVSIDGFLPHINKCKLIKIDVEGHEFEVLQGAKNLIEKARPHIMIEVFKPKRPQLMEWASDNKYDVHWKRGDDFYLTPKT
mgnify:FL=1